jgi:hypothetical protein
LTEEEAAVPRFRWPYRYTFAKSGRSYSQRVYAAHFQRVMDLEVEADGELRDHQAARYLSYTINLGLRPWLDLLKNEVDDAITRASV